MIITLLWFQPPQPAGIADEFNPAGALYNINTKVLWNSSLTA